MAIRHKHHDIVDPDLRHIFAVELMTLRKVCRYIGGSMYSEYTCGVRMGFETALRRVQGERLAQRKCSLCGQAGLHRVLEPFYSPGKIKP